MAASTPLSAETVCPVSHSLARQARRLVSKRRRSPRVDTRRVESSVNMKGRLKLFSYTITTMSNCSQTFLSAHIQSVGPQSQKNPQECIRAIVRRRSLRGDGYRRSAGGVIWLLAEPHGGQQEAAAATAMALQQGQQQQLSSSDSGRPQKCRSITTVTATAQRHLLPQPLPLPLPPQRSYSGRAASAGSS